MYTRRVRTGGVLYYYIIMRGTHGLYYAHAGEDGQYSDRKLVRRRYK